MKLALLTAGSRGDVEPFAALARTAQDAGHDAVLIVPRNSGVNLTGLSVRELDADYSAVIQSEGLSPWRAVRSMGTVVRPIMREVILGSALHARDENPDAVVFHPKVLSGPLVAGALGIPGFVAEIVPAVTPTREFPAAGTVSGSLGPLNRITYQAAAGASTLFRREIADAAAALDVSAESGPLPSLVPVSPHLLSRPADWPASTHLTGAWDVPDGVRDLLAAEVSDFLDGGDVLYAGFGSMSSADPERLGTAVVSAARERGLRTLVVTGLGGIAVPEALRGDDVCVTSSVPHGLVMSKVVAAVHHGGIGTVHAVARAGATSLVVAFFGDQPFWGARLHREGLAPAPIRARRLSARRLGRALDQLGRYAAANAQRGPEIAAERGAATALGIIERAVASTRS